MELPVKRGSGYEARHTEEMPGEAEQVGGTGRKKGKKPHGRT